jgi:peptide deformylase
MNLGTNPPIDDSLTLKIPAEGFKLVQHIPVNEKGREQNTLYQTPRPITKEEFNTPELTVFTDSLYQVMKKHEGVGIAANQIGKRLQIFIIEAKADNPRYKVLGPVEKQIFINPIITKVSSVKKNFWHGCLSANGEKRGNVATYEWIEYECQNLKGNKISGKLDGFAAVIFQHEFRHLMNGTYLDIAKQFLSKPELDKKIATGELPFFEVASDTLPLLIKDFEIGQSIEKFRGK